MLIASVVGVLALLALGVVVAVLVVAVFVGVFIWGLVKLVFTESES